MRIGHLHRRGSCELCMKFTDKLERHHESYRPERTIMLCHQCHHKIHFLPWQLKAHERDKLICRRLGPEEYIKLKNNKTKYFEKIARYRHKGRPKNLKENSTLHNVKSD